MDTTQPARVIVKNARIQDLLDPALSKKLSRITSHPKAVVEFRGLGDKLPEFVREDEYRVLLDMIPTLVHLKQGNDPIRWRTVVDHVQQNNGSWLFKYPGTQQGTEHVRFVAAAAAPQQGTEHVRYVAAAAAPPPPKRVGNRPRYFQRQYHPGSRRRPTAYYDRSYPSRADSNPDWRRRNGDSQKLRRRPLPRDDWTRRRYDEEEEEERYEEPTLSDMRTDAGDNLAEMEERRKEEEPTLSDMRTDAEDNLAEMEERRKEEEQARKQAELNVLQKKSEKAQAALEAEQRRREKAEEELRQIEEEERRPIPPPARSTHSRKKQRNRKKKSNDEIARWASDTSSALRKGEQEGKKLIRGVEQEGYTLLHKGEQEGKKLIRDVEQEGSTLLHKGEQEGKKLIRDVKKEGAVLWRDATEVAHDIEKDIPRDVKAYANRVRAGVGEIEHLFSTYGTSKQAGVLI